PLYFVSSNTHSLVNLLTGTARLREREIVAWLEREGPDYLREELAKFTAGRTKGSWENFLYFCARLFFEAQPEDSAAWVERRRHEHAVGITHLPSRTALRVSAQVIALDRLDPRVLDSRLQDLDATRLRASGAVIVNVDYPLRLAAYHVLRGIRVSPDTQRGGYVLGVCETQQTDTGEVLLPARVRRVDRLAARLLRAGQVGDPERRCRRRDDLQCHPRRALRLDVLARQRVLVRRHPAVPGLRLGAGQPARGDGQEHV